MARQPHSAYAEQLRALREEPWFRNFVREVLEVERPSVPGFVPAGDKEAGEQANDWIYRSGQRNGYEFALSHFGVYDE